MELFLAGLATGIGAVGCLALWVRQREERHDR